MQNKIKFIFIILFVFFVSMPAFAFSFRKKTQDPPKEKMVETKQQWLEAAQNIPLEDRELEGFKESQSDKKHYFPTPHYVFVKYNLND